MLTISSGVRPPDNTPPWTTADQEELLGALDQSVGHQNEILGATCQLVEGRQMKTTGEVELVEETLSVQSLYNALQDLTQVISREGVFDSKEDARAVSLSGPTGVINCMSNRALWSVAELQTDTRRFKKLLENSNVILPTNLYVLQAFSQNSTSWCSVPGNAINGRACENLLKNVSDHLQIPHRSMDQLVRESEHVINIALVTSQGWTVRQKTTGKTKAICQRFNSVLETRIVDATELFEDIKKEIEKMDQMLDTEMWDNIEEKFENCGLQDLMNWEEMASQQMKIQNCYLRENELRNQGQTGGRSRRGFSLIDLGQHGSPTAIAGVVNENFMHLKEAVESLQAAVLVNKAGVKLEGHNQQGLARQMTMERIREFSATIKELIEKFIVQERALSRDTMDVVMRNAEQTLKFMRTFITDIEELALLDKDCADRKCEELKGGKVVVLTEAGVILMKKSPKITGFKTLLLSCQAGRRGGKLKSVVGNNEAISTLRRDGIIVKNRRNESVVVSKDCLIQFNDCSDNMLEDLDEKELIGDNLFLSLSREGEHFQCLKSSDWLTKDIDGRLEKTRCNMKARLASFPQRLVSADMMIDALHHSYKKINFPRKSLEYDGGWSGNDHLYRDGLYYIRKTGESISKHFNKNWTSIDKNPEIENIHYGVGIGSIVTAAIALFITTCSCCRCLLKYRKRRREAAGGGGASNINIELTDRSRRDEEPEFTQKEIDNYNKKVRDDYFKGLDEARKADKNKKKEAAKVEKHLEKEAKEEKKARRQERLRIASRKSMGGLLSPAEEEILASAPPGPLPGGERAGIETRQPPFNPPFNPFGVEPPRKVDEK